MFILDSNKLAVYLVERGQRKCLSQSVWSEALHFTGSRTVAIHNSSWFMLRTYAFKAGQTIWRHYDFSHINNALLLLSCFSSTLPVERKRLKVVLCSDRLSALHNGSAAPEKNYYSTCSTKSFSECTEINILRYSIVTMRLMYWERKLGTRRQNASYFASLSTLCLKKLPALTLTYVNRPAKFCHCWKWYKICYKTQIFTSPYVCCCSTLEI